MQPDLLARRYAHQLRCLNENVLIKLAVVDMGLLATSQGLTC